MGVGCRVPNAYCPKKQCVMGRRLHCNDCIEADLAEVGDFFNPLSAGQDAIDISDIILGND